MRIDHTPTIFSNNVKDLQIQAAEREVPLTLFLVMNMSDLAVILYYSTASLQGILRSRRLFVSLKASLLQDEMVSSRLTA